MARPRRDSRQHNGITVRGLSQLTSATKSAPNGHADCFAECLLSGAKRKTFARGEYFRFCEGFRMPAALGTSPRVRRPASETLQSKSYRPAPRILHPSF